MPQVDTTQAQGCDVAETHKLLSAVISYPFSSTDPASRHPVDEHELREEYQHFVVNLEQTKRNILKRAAGHGLAAAQSVRAVAAGLADTSIYRCSYTRKNNSAGHLCGLSRSMPRWHEIAAAAQVEDAPANICVSSTQCSLCKGCYRDL